MGEPKIGDKLFLYGQLLVNLEEFNDYEYNALMGYATTGGYYVNLKKVDDDFFSVPGFVVDFYSDPVCLCLIKQIIIVFKINKLVFIQVIINSQTFHVNF